MLRTSVERELLVGHDLVRGVVISQRFGREPPAIGGYHQDIPFGFHRAILPAVRSAASRERRAFLALEIEENHLDVPQLRDLRGLKVERRVRLYPAPPDTVVGHIVREALQNLIGAVRSLDGGCWADTGILAGKGEDGKDGEDGVSGLTLPGSAGVGEHFRPLRLVRHLRPLGHVAAPAVCSAK
jgi:hypothetical protein